MPPIISVSNLSKTYDGGHEALKDVSLDIERGEILALLGPNGAGKTTLISIICGIVSASGGNVTVDGHDIVSDYRHTRSLIGLVPQEITLEPFETVSNTVNFSRGLFGKPRNPVIVEKVLRALTLWDKKDQKIMALSGGMKRRVLIAKALAHEPRILFLDEPTAGVDVELRKEMWQLVDTLRDDGVTIILTTHYIEEAEAIANRVGVINDGKLLLIEDKDAMMRRMGQKQMQIRLQTATDKIPPQLTPYDLERSEDGLTLTYTYDTMAERTGITKLLTDLNAAGLVLRDVQTSQSSLEQIFVDLVKATP
ncbi:MAG: ABC transporter ATP-binding protein [Rhizobiales bacterium]|nr:ABC transporter ATP-binding protein [Hyphomicrobiales bacterium]